MAELHLEFVSPESVLFSGDVDQVDLPGAEGDMGILAGHAPLVTTLRPGIVTIYRGGAREAGGGHRRLCRSRPRRTDRARRPRRGARQTSTPRRSRPRSRTPKKTLPTPPTKRNATSPRVISTS